MSSRHLINQPSELERLVPLNDAVEGKIYDVIERSEEREAKIQTRIMSITMLAGPVITVVLIVLSSFQGAIFLADMAGEGGKTLLNQTMSIATALVLIIGANYLGVRIIFTSKAYKTLGHLICILLFVFSALTSLFYYAVMMQSAADVSEKSALRIQIARERVASMQELARQSAYQQSLADYNKAVGQDGRNVAGKVETAEAALTAAQDELDKLVASGDTKAKMLKKFSNFFWGASVETFSYWFAGFIVVLMETLRWYMSVLTGQALFSSISSQRPKRARHSNAVNHMQGSSMSEPMEQEKTAWKPSETEQKQEPETTPVKPNSTGAGVRVSHQRRMAKVITAIKSGQLLDPSVEAIKNLLGISSSGTTQKIRKELVKLQVCERRPDGKLTIK